LVIELMDATSPAPTPAAGAGALRIATKIDLAPMPSGIEIGVAAPSGVGMGGLRDRLAKAARRLTDGSGPPPLTRARHRAALIDAAARLAAAIDSPLPELRGEDLRLALRAIGRVTGQVGVEDILDSVFRQFCIGK
jgi:tRNA modification GTPase